MCYLAQAVQTSVQILTCLSMFQCCLVIRQSFITAATTNFGFLTIFQLENSKPLGAFLVLTLIEVLKVQEVGSEARLIDSGGIHASMYPPTMKHTTKKANKPVSFNCSRIVKPHSPMFGISYP